MGDCLGRQRPERRERAATGSRRGCVRLAYLPCAASTIKYKSHSGQFYHYEVMRGGLRRRCRLRSDSLRRHMPMRSGLLGLGSNVGARRNHLQAAADTLPSVGVRVTAASSVYDTDPVGEVLDQASFLNACVLVETDLQPLQLLDAVKRLEAELGRAAGGPRHGPRVIDIDILLFGEFTLVHERMTLPHEQVLNRRFVLVPALELDFELVTPDGQRLADALAVLPVSEGVRWAGPPLSL
jgi:2-amino-4-hydroxy-6-hydroxymethyldihydropteridine diphosphokinase